ncbi:hypothetical protein GE061_008541 [Apolygus lucorum]|uniref:MADF domain-containing protein n=1 Tax=Apolygus lucorum TaxID=248454 RepID=A0A8S9WKU2_APOLU|nr:hypothetical protein GE061_008541 [Apolygus lucorum]
MATPSKKWAHEEVCLLIENYEANPILWDIRHPDYRDRVKKNLVTEKLANNFNCPVSEISRKLHNLRNQVSQELKKIKQKKAEVGQKKQRDGPIFRH